MKPGRNQCLITVLNNMVEDGDDRRRLQSTDASIRSKCTEENVAGLKAIGVKPCLVSRLSLDGRGRCQRAMRINGKKSNFRPWHICWIASNGEAPTSLQYSHRCHEGNCCEATHGIWENDATNKARNGCKSCSHVVLQDGRVIITCPHNPPCLCPFVVKEANRDSADKDKTT